MSESRDVDHPAQEAEEPDRQTETGEETEESTAQPTDEPTAEPTTEPTQQPTTEPTAEPMPEGAYKITVVSPAKWQKDKATAKINIVDVNGTGWANIRIVVATENGWQTVVDGDDQSAGYAVELRENATIHVSITDHAGNVQAKSEAISCFDSTPPTVKAGVSGEVICIEATDSTSGVAAVYVNGHKLKYSGTTLDANIREYADGRQQIIPVTYMNSSAALKAFCGRNGGIVCTSSNAHAVLEWAFARGKRVLFFPDQHLGRNTARAMGIPLSEMPLWDPYKAQGGATDPSDYAKAKMILWKGFCSVHQRFTVEQIEKARAAFPGVKVIVHPECSMQVVDAADGTGSTAYIVKEIANAPAGSAIAVGTEINLVNRLAAQYPDKTVFCLDPVVCPCSTMYRIHPAYLAWALENIEQGNIVNRITVDDDTAREAKVALERMLQVHP
mgnify:CR=1 FL=1